MKKVLILEDEENIRSFVVINLKRAGYSVVEAGTGEERRSAGQINFNHKNEFLSIYIFFCL